MKEAWYNDQPMHQKKAVRHKSFGLEQWSHWFQQWAHRQWYATKKARDQALADLEHKTTILKGVAMPAQGLSTCDKGTKHEPKFRKVNR